MLKSSCLITAGLLSLTAAPAAHAQAGPGGCTSSGTHGRCWVAATDPGRPGGLTGPPPVAAADPGRQAGGRAQGGPRYSCVDQPWTAPPAGDPLWGGHTPAQGSLHFMLCQGGGALQGWPRVVFAPNGQPVVVPQVSPAKLAEQAISEMGLSAPDIRLAPPADSPHGATIGFPVWMWTARREATTGPVTRTASAGPITVTATATLTAIDWSMGDGSTVRCSGPGSEFTDDQAGRPSPTCGHVYAHLTPGGVAGIDATSRWEIRWSGGGQSAFRTMALTSSARLPVREIRTLNTGGAR
ncbi:hypothetical protein Amsp01_048610 [Amycolatopsis sp. NBRC 101858]|uniref:hypothetical protein n=1 Tax=Amycolatopsis sp. NBRC 101858 TaxID=3032200 RepID=UPI0024A5EBAD|nr:hypothetical protein [Amycolatopsis sp. NBRC 101858]GLY38837.1 hypothetical protein Amsp01_048610 [Amycolatopsis sp. NBRC 101858]